MTHQAFKKPLSSTAKLPVNVALPNVTVQSFLHVPKMCNNDSLLPICFITLEKYFKINNIFDC